MCLWSDGGKIPRIYGVLKGNRGKPGQDPGYYGDGATKKCEGGVKPQRKNSGTKQVRVKGNEQVFTLLPNIEEIV